MSLPRIDLPPEAAALYRSGASIKAVAATFGCSAEGARAGLVRAGVQLRRPEQPDRTPATLDGLCRDCGEDLDRPHEMGTHLPGCSHGNGGA